MTIILAKLPQAMLTSSTYEVNFKTTSTYGENFIVMSQQVLEY